MKPGSKVLYLGAASGTSVSHVADIVGPTGAVFVRCVTVFRIGLGSNPVNPRLSNFLTDLVEISSTWL